MAKRNLRQESAITKELLRHFSTTNQGNKMTFHVKSKAQEIRNYVAVNPNAKPKDIAKAIGVGIGYVYTVMWTAKKKAAKTKLPRKTLTLKKIKEATARVQEFIRQDLKPTKPYTPMQVEMFEPMPDPVNHPAHYKVGGIETIDFIEAKKLGYNLGNVVKYLTRADHKGNKLEDLRKAQWYLTREINSLK
jgi:hypothetical protein